jgi:hypothetical protein
MRHHDTDDDNLWKTVTDTDGRSRRVLREGAVLRVPLTAMDSAHRFDDVQRSVRDATMNDLERLKALRDQAFEQRQYEDENAYKGDASNNGGVCPNCGFPLSKGYLTRAGGNGDETDDAARNPHNKHFDLDAARAARAQLYADVENEQANSWRKGKA